MKTLDDRAPEQDVAVAAVRGLVLVAGAGGLEGARPRQRRVLDVQPKVPYPVPVLLSHLAPKHAHWQTPQLR